MPLIEKITALCNLSADAKDFLHDHILKQEFKKGSSILDAGKKCDSLYLVSAGLLRGYYLNESKEVTNWIAADDDFGTSFYAFISGGTSYETIEALENTIAESINKESLEELYSKFPETERAGRILLQNYYLRLEERIIYLQFKSAKERYQTFFEKRKEVLKRAPLGCIASYLGITQETLSRIRAEK